MSQLGAIIPVVNGDPRLLFLIRHGRSDEGQIVLTDTPRGPQWDPPLDDVGRRQSELLARRLELMDPQPVAVYCSTMRRTRETVAPFAAITGARITYVPELIEAHVGDWEAKSFEEILESDDRMLHRYRNQDAIWEFAPGAEAIEDFRTRVNDAIEQIVARHPAGNIAIVAHGGVINAYVASMLALPQAMFFLPENTSINTIELDGDQRRVRFLNDDRHLAMPALFAP